MELFVNDKIKCSAKVCHNDYVCLTKQKENICKVISTLNNNVIYINCLSKKDCPYKHKMEERMFCTCPVRIEI